MECSLNFDRIEKKSDAQTLVSNGVHPVGQGE